MKNRRAHQYAVVTAMTLLALTGCSVTNLSQNGALGNPLEIFGSSNAGSDEENGDNGSLNNGNSNNGNSNNGDSNNGENGNSGSEANNGNSNSDNSNSDNSIINNSGNEPAGNSLGTTIDRIDISNLENVSAVTETGSKVESGEAADLVFSEDGVTAYDQDGNQIVKPTNVTITDNTATITMPGTIRLSGGCSEGQVIVNVDKDKYPDAEVELELSGLTLSNSLEAPIYVESVDGEAILVAKKGTVNVISDGLKHTDTYTNSDGETKTIDAAIFSRDDLKIKGQGILVVNGQTEDGIVSRDDLKIYNGTIQVTAVDDGLRAEDEIVIGKESDSANYDTLNLTITTNSGDGIHSEGTLYANGGSVTISAADDGLHSDGDLYIGGKEASEDTTVTTINIIKSKEAVEGVNIYMNAGTLKMIASDDGFNAAGGTSDSNGKQGGFMKTDVTEESGTILNTSVTEQTQGTVLNSALSVIVNDNSVTVNDNFVIDNADLTDEGFGGFGGFGGGHGGFMSSSTGTLYIQGGYTYIQAKGDALDANGNAYVSGGTTVICGYTSGDTSPLDVDGTLSYTGGTLMGFGGTMMMVTPSEYSFLTTGAKISSGTQITVTDTEGNVLSTLIAPNGCQGTYFFYCGSEKDVKVYTGGTITGANMVDQYYGTGGSISGGTEMSQTNSGQSGFGGFGGGPGGFGGNQGGNGGQGGFGPGNFNKDDFNLDDFDPDDSDRQQGPFGGFKQGDLLVPDGSDEL